MARGQVTRGVLGADCDHAAADVNADRRRNDSAECRNHRAGGGTFPEVGVGISARCGKMNGLSLAMTAWSRVFSSRIDAQLMSRLLIRSIRGQFGDLDLTVFREFLTPC